MSDVSYKAGEPISGDGPKERDKGMLMLLCSFVMQMCHSYQRRKNDQNMPYGIHPQAVAINTLPFLRRKLENEMARIAGLFHDIIEDCSIEEVAQCAQYWNNHFPYLAIQPQKGWGVETYLVAMLERALEYTGYPKKVATTVIAAVNELTVPKIQPGLYEDKAGRKKWESSYDRMSTLSPIALMSIWADKTFNLRSPIPGRDPAKEMTKYGRYFDSIITTLEERGYKTPPLPDDIKQAVELYRQTKD